MECADRFDMKFFNKFFKLKEIDQAKRFVLSYPKMEELIDGHLGDKKKVDKIIEELHGEINPGILGFLAGLIGHTFARLYDRLNLELPEGMDLKKTVEENNVILVPNHQSHADYLAISYLILKNHRLPVRIAGGINLNIFPIGFLFRNSGCFFIRRRFQGDPLYKIAFEAYIAYLLKEGQMVEFFFEGGRSRTGKLLAPKYGLFNIILETHSQMENAKPLMFIPVSVAHEYIPEFSAHARELRGGEKKKESSMQLLNIPKLFTKKLGSIHIRLGEGIRPAKQEVTKLSTQNLAFKCFRKVGDGMPVTPMSLLALVMLDEPAGAITWENIEKKSSEVISFCKDFNIPLAKSLQNDDFMDALDRSLELTIRNGRVEKIEKEKLQQIFYVIRDDYRIELLYFKNMILHHFLVASFINAAWLNVYYGNITTLNGLAKFLLVKRRELKYEFYLPAVRTMISQALQIVSKSIDRKIESLEECLNFSAPELYSIASRLKAFSSAFSYIYEAYYLSGTAVRHLLHDKFTEDRFVQISKEVFEMEKDHGRVIKYSESYSVPLMKNSLRYYVNKNIIKKEGDHYSVEDFRRLENHIEKFANNLTNNVVTSFKFNQV